MKHITNNPFFFSIIRFDLPKVVLPCPLERVVGGLNKTVINLNVYKMVCFAYASKTGVKNCLSDDFFNPVVTLTDDNFEAVTGISLDSLPLGSVISDPTSGSENGTYTSYNDKSWIISVTKSTESCDACKETKTAMTEIAENIQETTNGAIKLATIDADQNPILAEKIQGLNFAWAKTY